MKGWTLCQKKNTDHNPSGMYLLVAVDIPFTICKYYINSLLHIIGHLKSNRQTMKGYFGNIGLICHHGNHCCIYITTHDQIYMELNLGCLC